MEIETFFERFNQLKVAIIGDVMIDSYIVGKVTRVSPEAPVPVVNLKNKENRLGGAANVALNIASLGAKPIMCSCIGNDEDSETLIHLLNQAGISDEGIIRSDNRQTTVKTRVIGNNQHLIRIDSEQSNAINQQEETKLIAKIKTIIDQGIDAIIFEDYNKGVLTKQLITEIISYANQRNIITTVDPKKENFFAYQKVTLFKPNLKELKEGTGIDFEIQETEKFQQAISILEKKLNNQISFVTLSEHGVFIKDQHASYQIPAHIRNIADVSGAGDTVISVATLCLAAGADTKFTAECANISGGIVCEKSGVISIQKSELIHEVKRLVGAFVSK